MPSPTAFLIYATVTTSGFPAQQWTAVEYPSLAICQAKAAEFRAALAKPESIAERAGKQITIKIEPRCVSEPPQVWIVEAPK